jgi:hypothetical protein
MRWWIRARAPLKNLCKQARGHAIALISLLLALTSITYGTWRDERTERNRNIRSATFEILSKLADFERIVFLAHYDRDHANGNPRIGWTDVIVIHDLAIVAPAPLESKATKLTEVWRNNWEQLDSEDDVAVEHIEAAVEDLRLATLTTLHSLR